MIATLIHEQLKHLPPEKREEILKKMIESVK